jgi:hypothetical protein
VLYLGSLAAASSYGLTLLLPAFVDAAGGSQAQVGLIYWCGALGAAGALAVTGRLTGRISAAWCAAAGSGLYAVAAGLLAWGALSGSVYGAWRPQQFLRTFGDRSSGCCIFARGERSSIFQPWRHPGGPM